MAPKRAGSSTFSIPTEEYSWPKGADPRTRSGLNRLFHSPKIERLKRKMCEIGRRMWQREYVDGNGGNITLRIGDNLVLCTPTLVSKGFMHPRDICLVDLAGKQLLGTRRRTSEALTHLGIMQRQPLAKACIHAHPPHATAFAIGAPPPSALLTEAEIFLGVIGQANYQTPGGPGNAEEVGRVGSKHQATIMANHGAIVWGSSVEEAYWRLEIVDTYCRTVWIALQGGGPLAPIPEAGMRELIALRKSLGMPDERPC